MANLPAPEIQKAGLNAWFQGENEKFKPIPGESYATWQTRIKNLATGIGWPLDKGMMFQYQRPEFAQKIAALTGWDMSTPDGAVAAQGQGPGQSGPMNRNAEVDAFYRMMMDPNAPELQAAQQGATNLAQRGAAGRGIRGGLSDAGIRKAGLDARMGLASQRAGMGLQALQGGMNYDLGMGTQAIQRNGMQFDQNQSTEINRANADRAKWQAVAAAGGQVASGLIEASKSYGSGGGGGTPGSYYSSYSPAADMAQSPYGGVGANSAGGSAADWNSYPGSGNAGGGY